MPAKDEEDVEFLIEALGVTIDDRKADACRASGRQSNEKIAKVSLTRRAAVLLSLSCYALLVYGTVFCLLTFIDAQTPQFLDVLKSTVAKTYGAFTDKYHAATGPATTREVADLMTEFYELLAEMGYYEPSIINRPPHIDPSINKTLAVELGFSAAAIEMMEMLPYLNMSWVNNRFEWSHGAGHAEFFLYGTFVDLRNDTQMFDSLDPLYGWQDREVGDFDVAGGPYMRPDYVCLMTLGNHGAVMVLNVQNMKLWTIDQEIGNVDFATVDGRAERKSANDMAMENYPSRLARDALRDYMKKFRDLEWMPGGLSLSHHSWISDEYARLYREAGWPDNFSRVFFKGTRLQWEDDEKKR